MSYGMTDEFHVLLVEDNAPDAYLVQEALAETRHHPTIHVVTDGAKALAFLRREPPYEQAVRPDLVLLDLNMPKMGGLEVLAVVKQDQAFVDIPVVVLTTSRADADIGEAYLLGANCYVPKPVDLNEFVRALQVVHDLWFAIAELPDGHTGHTRHPPAVKA